MIIQQTPGANILPHVVTPMEIVLNCGLLKRCNVVIISYGHNSGFPLSLLADSRKEVR